MGGIDLKSVRKSIIEMAHVGGSCHIGCALSVAPILVGIMNRLVVNSDRDRDYLILSKGHAASALYACLIEKGVMSQHVRDNYLSDGSGVFGACESGTDGVDASTGSLGHGLPIAVGMALGLKMSGSERKIYCVCGDGEMNEGSNYESILFASHHKLDNLEVIVDANGYQAMGSTKSVLDMKHAFNWMESLVYPNIRIVKTVKGAGVSFMEGNNAWHYSKMSDDDYRKAMA